MRKCRSPRSLVLGIRNLLWFLVRSEYAISGRSRGRRNRGGVWRTLSPSLLGPGGYRGHNENDLPGD